MPGGTRAADESPHARRFSREPRRERTVAAFEERRIFVARHDESAGDLARLFVPARTRFDAHRLTQKFAAG